MFRRRRCCWCSEKRENILKYCLFISKNEVKSLVKLSIIILFAFTQILFSQPVSQEMVDEVSRNFLAQHRQMVIKKKFIKAAPAISKIQILKEPKTEIPLAHVINLNPKGFIVLSNDQGIEPVIAYSFNSNFSMDTTHQNILYHMVIKDMTLRKEALPLIEAEIKNENRKKWDQLATGMITYLNEAAFQQWPPEGSTTTGGWVETTWNQSSPFNDFCPLDPMTGTRSVVGCVATAMAQIIHYHEHIGSASFDINDEYTTPNGINIDSDSTMNDFPSFERINLGLDSIDYKYQNNVALNNADLAALNFAVGITVSMQYSSSESGAYSSDIVPALLDKFNYNSAEYNTTGLPLFLKSNMVNGLPALLGLQIYLGPGHLIVADGVNTDGFYHLNYGWGENAPQNIMLMWYHLDEELPPYHFIFTDAVYLSLIHI